MTTGTRTAFFGHVLATGIALLAAPALMAVSLDLTNGYEEGTIAHPQGSYNYHRWTGVGSHEGTDFDVIAIVTGGTNTMFSNGGPAGDVSPGFGKISFAASPLNPDGNPHSSVFTWVNLMFIRSGAAASSTSDWVQLPSVDLSWVDFDGVDIQLYDNSIGGAPTTLVAAEQVGMNLANQMPYIVGNATGKGTSGVFGVGASGMEISVGGDVSTNLNPADRPNTFESEGGALNWAYSVGYDPELDGYAYRNNAGNIPNQYLIDPLSLHPSHAPAVATVRGTNVEGWRMRLRTATESGFGRALYFTGEVTNVPEPGPGVLSGFGLLLVLMQRRRA